MFRTLSSKLIGRLVQVDELYETYGVQWRLCQGAVNMKRAFSLSPSTRASRESLLELGRNHRLSLQVPDQEHRPAGPRSRTLY